MESVYITASGRWPSGARFTKVVLGRFIHSGRTTAPVQML